MATSVEDPQSVDTQAGENLGTAACGNEVCVETEESEFEKCTVDDADLQQEKQRQLRRKNPKKAKRKRVFVVTPQTRTVSSFMRIVVDNRSLNFFYSPSCQSTFSVYARRLFSTHANEKVTTVVNEKGEELLQIARDVDIEKADELFVNEVLVVKAFFMRKFDAITVMKRSKEEERGINEFQVAAEMSELADDEFQMKPRRYGVNICSYISYWFTQ
uniref:Ras-associating domain-containing protein n=1 Tax=Ascaris lumbricoides TaxID=6252 RepID=A0A0M3I003_ASCLU